MVSTKQKVLKAWKEANGFWKISEKLNFSAKISPEPCD
jgi:hypothetical protein